jgi:hypothetical protein
MANISTCEKTAIYPIYNIGPEGVYGNRYWKIIKYFKVLFFYKVK